MYKRQVPPLTVLTLPLPLLKKTDRVGTLGICSIPFFTKNNQEVFRSNRSNHSNALEMQLRHAISGGQVLRISGARNSKGIVVLRPCLSIALDHLQTSGRPKLESSFLCRCFFSPLKSLISVRSDYATPNTPNTFGPDLEKRLLYWKTILCCTTGRRRALLLHCSCDQRLVM